jgi:hypothetical protein
MREYPPIEFPSRPVKPEHEDRLGPVRCAAWAFAFEVAICMAVLLVWKLRLIFR